MKDTVLVIIDMQGHFSASHSRRTQANVIRAILNAKREGHGIILVEYFGNGETHDIILNACAGYDKFYRVSKTIDDGSRAVLAIAGEFDLPLAHFVLCGVNLQFCVRDTAIGLASQDRNRKVTILEPACNGFNERSIRKKRALFASHDNISLITEKEAQYAAE